MRVLVPTHYSRAIVRIGDALARHAPPGVEVARIPPCAKDSRRHWLVPGEDDGDLVVLFANGLHDHMEALAQRCVSRGQKYAVVQIALRTTRQPSTDHWRWLWRKAAVVWSYYPLGLWIQEDGGAPMDFHFYHAPLGVDPIFYDRAVKRDFTVCTSGQRRSQESVAECDEAAAMVGGSVFQLGPSLAMKADATCLTDVSDVLLAHLYSRCLFVSGLRREEGFELPAAEGLMCGARPVVYDRPHYRAWYDGWAEFVPEGNANEVTKHLAELFLAGPRRVEEREKDVAASVFDWQRIAAGFWERALA